MIGIKENKTAHGFWSSTRALLSVVVLGAFVIGVSVMAPGCSDNPVAPKERQDPEAIDSLYTGRVTHTTYGMWGGTESFDVYIDVDAGCFGYGCGDGPRLAIARKVVSYTYQLDPDAPSTPPTISVSLIWEGDISLSSTAWSADCIDDGYYFKAAGDYSETSISGSYEMSLLLMDGTVETDYKGHFECDWAGVTLSDWPNSRRPYWLDCERNSDIPAPDVGVRLFSVAWDGHQYIAGGSGIFTSSDAVNWTYRKLMGENDVRQIIAGNNRLIGLGDNGTIIGSTDGIEWTYLHARSYDAIFTVFGGAYNGHRYVVVGSRRRLASDDPEALIITTSVDGINWEPQIMDNQLYFEGAFWTGQEFVILFRNTRFTSADGVSWTPTSPNIPYRFRNVIWADSQFLATANLIDCCVILSSADGLDWSELSRIDEYNSISFACSPDGYVTFGNDSVNSSLRLAYYSHDGLTWEPVDFYSNYHIFSVEWLGDRFIAVGGEQALTSYDGINWTRHVLTTD